MNLPEKLQVFAHAYTVASDPKEFYGSMDMGSCDSNTLKINIAPFVPESSQAETLLHEIMEAINYHFELQLEHHALTVLALGVFTVIRENNLDFRKHGEVK